jgi:O-antigen/teichoic acid export membrane protein
MTEDSLKTKTVKGVTWSTIDNVAGYAVTFIVGIILARLLSPEDYGLLGLIAIFTAICSCFINAGFGSALIRKKDVTDDDYNTVFIFNLVMSLVLYGLMFICAPLIADFFGRKELVALTRVSSLGMIIGALATTQRTRLIKRIDFKTQTKITIISAVVRGVVGITAAFIGWGVWALVAQELTATTLSTILLWHYNRWIPNLRFSVTSFKELFGYGSKLLVSSLIDTLWKEAYQVVIGKCYTPATLGQYTRATMFSNLFSSNLTNIIQRVSFPVLSEIQEDRSRLKSGYQRIIKITMLISFSCMLMLAAIAKPMIIVMIGEKWTQAAYFLQIVCFSSMLYPLHAINLNMLQVQGRSDLFLNLEIIKKTIAIGPLLLGVFFSIYWMLIGSVVTGFVSYYLNAYYSGPFLNYSIKDQIKDIFPSFRIALIAAMLSYLPVVVFETTQSSITWSKAAFFILPVQLVIGFLTIFFLNEKYHTSEYSELKSIVQSAFHEKRKNKQ